jgi:hypothetical protein
VGKPDDYEPVQDRIAKFWQDHPDGRILTDLIYRDDKQYIVRAEVWKQHGQVAEDASGYAEEIVGSTHVNKTNALENAETSAIGRALANMGYATKARPSKEEMQKVDRAEKAATARKVLLEHVDSHKLDRAKVAQAFLLTHKIPLHQHPNADAIIAFGRALAADPEKTLNPPLPPEARDDARRD